MTVAMMALTFWRCGAALSRSSGEVTPEGMAMRAINFVSAALQAAIDGRLHPLAADEAPVIVATMAPTSLEVRSCSLRGFAPEERR